MRYHTNINNSKCIEWGLNASQGALFDLLNQLSSWANGTCVDGKVLYHISRNKVIEELPLFYTKPDTVYRHFKVLEEKGLIFYKKDNLKDLVSLTKKGMEWNSQKHDHQIVDNPQCGKSHIRENTTLGKTHKHSNTDINTNTNKNNNKNITKDLFSKFWDEYHRLSKKNKTDREAAFKHWKRLSKQEMDDAIENILHYVKSVDDIRYVKKARTYLADKNFNDEFPTKRKGNMDGGLDSELKYTPSKDPDFNPANINYRDICRMGVSEQRWLERNHPHLISLKMAEYAQKDNKL
jgi:DNA-binding PadR family transcriptional regulator